MSNSVVRLTIQTDVSNLRPFVSSALLISHHLWVSGGGYPPKTLPCWFLCLVCKGQQISVAMSTVVVSDALKLNQFPSN